MIIDTTVLVDLLRGSNQARSFLSRVPPSENAALVSLDVLPSTKLPDTAAGRSPARAGLSRRSYPKFLRDGDTIIKLGWSKSAKAEYEHKAPKRVVTHLLAILAKLGATKKRATMDDVLPLKDPVSGTEVPAYQSYLCLAWLRSVGIVTQHGRQGYSLAKKDDVAARTEECWRQLATR